MEGVTIIETEVLYKLIDSIEILHKTVTAQIENASKPYLTTKEVCEMLSKSENWLLLHKEQIGFSKRTGALLFKRKDVDDFIEEGYYSVKKQKRKWKD